VLSDAFSYDAVYVLAHALKQLLDTEVINPTNNHTTFADLFVAERLVPGEIPLSAMSRAVRNVSFEGPSGMVEFDQSGARASLYEFCRGGNEVGFWWCIPWGMWSEQTGWVVEPGVQYTNGTSTPTKDTFGPRPVGFIETRASATTAQLSWPQPELNFGRDVQYNVRVRVKWAPKAMSTGNYSSSYSVVYSGADRSLTLHDLPDGTVFEVEVETVTHAGSSSFSGLTEFYTPRVPFIQDISTSAASVAGALGAVGSIISVAFMGWLHLKRNHPVVRASSLLFCHLVLLGTLIAYQSITMLSLQAKGSADMDATCAATPFLLQTAFALVFVSMFVKTYRLYRIFFQKVLSAQLRLTDGRLLMPVIGYVAFGLVVNIIWSANDDWRRAPFVEFRGRPIFSGSLYTQSVGTRVCHDMADSALVFWCILLVPNLTLMGLFMVVSFKVRTLTENFNESRHIAMALWNFMFILLTSLGVASSNLDPDTAFLFHAAAIWAMCLSTTLILFLPKVFAVMTWNSRVAPSDTALTGDPPTYTSHSAAEYSKSGTDHWTGGVPHGGRGRASTVTGHAARKASLSVGTSGDTARYGKASPSTTVRPLPHLRLHHAHAPTANAASLSNEQAVAHPVGIAVTSGDAPLRLLSDPKTELLIPIPTLQHDVPHSVLPAQRIILTPLPPVKPRVSTGRQQSAVPARDPSTSTSPVHSAGVASDDGVKHPKDIDATRAVGSHAVYHGAAIMSTPLLALSEPASPASPVLAARTPLET